MNIVLLGPPGAGKGTQSIRCQRRYQFTPITPGDLLRQHTKRDTELGKLVATYIDVGKLVPHEVVMSLVAEQLKPPKGSYGFLFDGFPRAIDQALSLDKLLIVHGFQLDGVIFIEVPEREIKKRIKERAKFSGRTDDQDEARVATRMQVYYQETQPLIAYYEKQRRLFQVDGVGDTEAVFGRIIAILDSLQEVNQQLKQRN